MLFKALSVPAVMAVFRALLSECRIIMISEDLVRLSTCMYSICSLVFPFAWQNIFVPIIPEMFLDYCTAPMPFIVGVHTSLMPQVERIPGIEDDVVFVNLDTNEVSLDMDSLKELPAEEEAKLTAQVTRLFSDLTSVKSRFSRKKTTTPAMFNASIEDAFNQFMLSIFGNYRRYLDPNDDWEFDIDAYTEIGPSNKYGVFLEAFRESQMFEAWCTERSELARRKFPSSNKFEDHVSNIVKKVDPKRPVSASPARKASSSADSGGNRDTMKNTAAVASQSTPAPAKLERVASGGASSAEAEGAYAVGYGSNAAVVEVEDKRIKGGWAKLWLDLDGDCIRFYDVDEDGKFFGQPLAVIPCEYTKTSNPKSAREDAPHAFRIDVETTQTAGGAGMHQGWMTKKGGFKHGGNKRRWCQMQLQGLELAYYDQNPSEGGQLKGEIDLSVCESVGRGYSDPSPASEARAARRGADEEEGQHTIELAERSAGSGDGETAGTVHVFVCEDKESCDVWLEALEGALADISTGKAEEPTTPGVDRRIRTGPQFRKKYIVRVQEGDEKMHWLSVLGGNSRGRRRFANVRGKGTQLRKRATEGGAAVADEEEGMIMIEPQNMIQSIFLDCDKDNDGALSATEYSDFLRTIGSWGKHKYTDATWEAYWCVI